MGISCHQQVMSACRIATAEQITYCSAEFCIVKTCKCKSCDLVSQLRAFAAISCCIVINLFQGEFMSDSLQKWVGRNRPPRVQITYDVEIGDAVEKKELPMVVGLLADLSGQPATPLPKLKDRRLAEIDRDNFNGV